MGSKFVEKHQRRSVLAALLFIFQGRVKYVTVALLLVVLSLPFVISGETLSRIMELPPVAAFMRTVGLERLGSAINSKYSNDDLKAALDKAAVDNKQNSLWARFLKSVNATPSADGPSTLAMVRGGGDDAFGPPEIKDEKYGKRGPGQVKGVVNEEERKRGETGDEVDLKGLLAGGPGGPGGAGGPGGGLYGDLMGEGLAGSFGGGGGSASASRSSIIGVGGRSAGMYNRVTSNAAGMVPVAGIPQKSNTKKMGRVSGFSWKNVGYKKKNAQVGINQKNAKPMFQLAEAFTMTGIAAYNKDSAPEYQAAYVGTTYDGNNSNLDVIQTDASSPVVPDSSFAGDLMAGAQDAEKMGKECSAAQGSHGAAMSSDARLISDIRSGMRKPDDCCPGSVKKWNGEIASMAALCEDYNSHDTLLATACKSSPSPMNCNEIRGAKINPCGWIECFLAFLFGKLLKWALGAASVIGVILSFLLISPLKKFIDLITGDKGK